ncbi:MAG: PHP domain-containing protein, partial [Woeseia sp.]
MKFDLHTHTNASDGELQPAELVARACQRGVTHLAITDHDTLRAYDSLDCPAELTLITGIELSTRWRKRGIHIVGLNLARDNADLNDGIARQQIGRKQRARKIADRLVKAGLPDLFDAVTTRAGNSNIGRPHFAQELVAAGHVRDVATAFKKYLGDNKLGDVRESWADMPEVIRWIRSAGGVAVLAHPAHYKLTRSKLCELLEDFIAAGGAAIEVISGRQDAKETRRLAGL